MQRTARVTHNPKTKQWHFSLIGENGKKVGTGETYKRQGTMVKTIKKYFPGFRIVDAPRAVITAILATSLFFSAAGQVTVVTLTGTASDPEGGPLKYKWTQVGTTPIACTISKDTMLIATVVPSGGQQWRPGQYTFQLAVTDNQGATSIATTRVNWTSNPPFVDAGPSQNATLPVATLTLKATGKATVGKVTWTWEQVGGPGTVVFSRKDTSTVQISNFVAGTYNFRVILADNYGASAVDTVSVQIKAANMAPAANAGPDQSITLPQNTVTIGGPDQPAGADMAIRWYQESGPAGAKIENPTAAFTKITGLTKGQYQYVKQITLRTGQTSQDKVTVTVRKCSWWQQLFGRC